MDLKLHDKIILITGASRGLGFACSKILAEEGAKIILSSRSEKNLKSASNEIASITNSNPDWVVCDVANSQDINSLKNTIQEKYGTLDGLVINAGGPPTGSTLEMTEEQWNSAIETNFLSVVRLCKEFVPLMQKKSYGRIVAITSVSVKQPLPNLVLSNSTRLAVVGFLKTLANEVGQDNVLVNVVMPGTTNTRRLQQVIQGWAQAEQKSVKEIIQDRTSQIPLKRFGEPDELGSFVTFLVSGKNTYITGQVIPVDGGFISSSL